MCTLTGSVNICQKQCLNTRIPSRARANTCRDLSRESHGDRDAWRCSFNIKLTSPLAIFHRVPVCSTGNPDIYPALIWNWFFFLMTVFFLAITSVRRPACFRYTPAMHMPVARWCRSNPVAKRSVWMTLQHSMKGNRRSDARYARRVLHGTTWPGQRHVDQFSSCSSVMVERHVKPACISKAWPTG